MFAVPPLGPRPRLRTCAPTPLYYSTTNPPTRPSSRSNCLDDDGHDLARSVFTFIDFDRDCVPTWSREQRPFPLRSQQLHRRSRWHESSTLETRAERRQGTSPSLSCLSEFDSTSTGIPPRREKARVLILSLSSCSYSITSSWESRCRESLSRSSRRSKICQTFSTARVSKSPMELPWTI